MMPTACRATRERCTCSCLVTSTPRLAHVLAAVAGTAGTGDPSGRVLLALELVVIRELLPHFDPPLGVDADVLAPVHRDDLGVAIGVAAVVDEAGRTPLASGVHNPLVVHPEQVVVQPRRAVLPLPLVRQLYTHHFPNVLDDELLALNGLHRVHAPALDLAPAELELLGACGDVLPLGSVRHASVIVVPEHGQLFLAASTPPACAGSSQAARSQPAILPSACCYPSSGAPRGGGTTASQCACPAWSRLHQPRSC
mmetsp:Transcript_3085/g.6709  ORF Transcript_3085/g.6709 Transcript_3085/m.6709 type:complete len:254 (-) Transcript_3085:478-1239(-)